VTFGLCTYHVYQSNVP